MERRSAHWGLRAVLFAVLAALLTTALIVEAMPPSVRKTFAAPPPAIHHKKGRPGGTNPKTSYGGSGVPTVPKISDAFTGSITEPQVGGGCGFALSGQVESAPVGSCTVLEIGDSLGNDLGWGLQRQVAPDSGLRLIQLDKSSTGLANSGFYNWPAELASDLREYHPQLVLISLGGNDEQGLYTNGSAVQFPTAAWQTAYTERVRELVSEATASGAYVLWVGMPNMQQPSYSQGMQLLNSIYKQVVTSEPNATFVPTWQIFSNPQGAFQANAMVNGKSATLRSQDGIHYSYAGEDVLATYVLREMALIYHVQLAPTNPEQITGW